MRREILLISNAIQIMALVERIKFHYLKIKFCERRAHKMSTNVPTILWENVSAIEFPTKRESRREKTTVCLQIFSSNLSATEAKKSLALKYRPAQQTIPVCVGGVCLCVREAMKNSFECGDCKRGTKIRIRSPLFVECNGGDETCCARRMYVRARRNLINML